MSIVAAILDRAGGPGSLTVLGTGPRPAVLGWAQLHQHARRMTTVLARCGVGRGARVGLLGDPSPDLIAALQAVWLAGAAVAVLPAPSRRARPDPLAPILADADFALLVVAGAGPGPGRAGPPVLVLPELVRQARTATPAAVRLPDPADLAVLQYTSGSTSAPRGVPVTHAHLAAQLTALRQAFLPVTQHPEPMLSWLPLYHDMGLVGFLAYPMSRGAPLVLQPPAAFALRPASWLEQLSRHRSVVTGAPDFAYRLLAPLLEAGFATSGTELDLSAVRLMLSGGEPISTGATARFLAAAQRYGLDPGGFVPAYGLAEATLAVSCPPPGTGLTTDRVDPELLERDGRAVPARPGGPVRVLARLGRPVPGTRLRIVNHATGGPAGERTVGEVEVQGPSVVGHYWRRPPPAGGWLRTGDLGYLAGGELVVCGRSKDVLFAAGRNLYPQDIEAAAGQVPGVRPGGAVAFGLPGEHGDRLVVLVETRTPDRPAVCRAVRVAVTSQTGLRPVAVRALPPGRIPRTSSGKLRRAEARRRYLDGGLDHPSTQEGHVDDQPDHRPGPVAGVPAGARGAA